METVNDIRKAIKPLGFNIKLKSLSWGVHATYIDNTTKRAMPSIFTRETLKHWKPLIDWRKENREALKSLRSISEIIGLI